MLNKVIITGNVADKPEIRYTGNGMAICNAKLRHTRNTNFNGNRKTETSIFVMDSFGEVAEEISRLQQGEAIVITGRLKMDEWEDEKTHQKRTKLKIIIESFEFLADGVDEEPEEREEQPELKQPPARRPAPKEKSQPVDTEEDTDVPF